MMNKINQYMKIAFLILIYYLIFENGSLTDYLNLNIYYSFQSNKIILNNMLFFYTIILFFMSYLFNQINNYINMKEYIIVRTKKIKNLIIKKILISITMFFILKSIIDILIFGSKNISTYIILNTSLFCYILINTIIYIILYYYLYKESVCFLLIISINLLINMTYVYIPILKYLTLIPYDILNNTIKYIIVKLIFIIGLILYYLYLDTNIDRKTIKIEGDVF